MKTHEIILQHAFVETVPRELNEHTLYVSIQYATAVHKCCCGCGHQVVTPLSPTDWAITFDGATVSLKPSIGNWSFACRSHYWIDRSRVIWSENWSQSRVDAARTRDRLTKTHRYSEGNERVLDTEHARNNTRRPPLWDKVKALWNSQNP